MPNKRHKRILVVDDDPVITSILATIFRSHYYDTATASSGEEAVQIAASFHPDCIVSDINMGALNGIDAAISILDFLPNCKVLFMSGNVNCRELVDGARAKGFRFEVLQKPAAPAELLNRISLMFSQPASHTDSHCVHHDCTFPTTAKKPGSESLDNCGTPLPYGASAKQTA
jgi:CheY-like chemotaxis protein